MKIIYSGGWNNKREESIRASFVFRYRDTIFDAMAHGKKIAFVTLAKPDGYYDFLLSPIYQGKVDVIDSKNLDSVSWQSYDGLFMLGGGSVPLMENLKKGGFSLKKLKPDCVVLGDSAGAYVLSSYFYNSPPGPERGHRLEFLKGFNPEAKVITIAHTNNPVYCNDILTKKVNAFAKKKNISVLALAENEQRILLAGEFAEVVKHTLFKS